MSEFNNSLQRTALSAAAEPQSRYTFNEYPS